MTPSEECVKRAREICDKCGDYLICHYCLRKPLLEEISTLRAKLKESPMTKPKGRRKFTATFRCDCSGHNLRLEYDKDGMLFMTISDRHSKKTKFKIKGYLGDVVLYNRPERKELSRFIDYIAAIRASREGK